MPEVVSVLPHSSATPTTVYTSIHDLVGHQPGDRVRVTLAVAIQIKQHNNNLLSHEKPISIFPPDIPISERGKLYQRRYYQKNKATIQQRQRDYYWANHEEVLAKTREYQRKYRAKNKNHINRKKREWRLKKKQEQAGVKNG